MILFRVPVRSKGNKSVDCRSKDCHVDVDFAQSLVVDWRQTCKKGVEST